jgi:hypothetical protein
LHVQGLCCSTKTWFFQLAVDMQRRSICTIHKKMGLLE